MPSGTEQGKIQAKIQLTTSESNGEQIQLIIPQDQYGKFKGYSNIDKDGNVIDKEFYAGLTLDDRHLYITGSFDPQKKVEENVHLSISSVGTQGNGQPATNLQRMKEKLSLNGKPEVEVNISKHLIKELKDNADQLQEKEKEIEIFKSLGSRVEKLEGEKRELQTQLAQAEQEKNKVLETANQQAEQKNKELEAAKEKVNKLELEKLELQTELDTANTEKTALEEAKQQVEQENTELQTKLDIANTEKTALEEAKQQKDELIVTLQDKNELAKKLKEKDNQIKELNVQVDQLKQKTQVLEATNAEVKKLNKELEAQKSQVQQLLQKNKELEAQKQPTEQPKQSKAPMYTATVGVGLAAGLVAFIALERTVRLDIWVTVGIAVVAALAISGGTYLALKPSTQVSEVEAQKANENAHQPA